MRLGLAGVGRIGAFHARTLQSLAGVDGIVIADADKARAQVVATELGVDVVDDVETLLRANIDGVVIASSTDSHAELICRAADAGLPVFCEKPVAESIDETVAVNQKLGERTERVQIGFQRRFDAGYGVAREAVANGSIGWIHTLRAGTLDPAPPPAAYIARSGGIFKDCSVHDFDIIRWVTGREVVEVFATGSNRGEKFFTESGDVDTAAALLRLDDDTLAMVSATRYNAAGYDVRLEVLGSKASVAVGMDDRLALHSAEPAVAWPTGQPYANFMERFQPAYVRELEVFTEVVAGRRKSPCTVADALEATYVAQACEISRREHRPVAMSEVRS